MSAGQPLERCTDDVIHYVMPMVPFCPVQCLCVWVGVSVGVGMRVGACVNARNENKTGAGFFCFFSSNSIEFDKDKSAARLQCIWTHKF